MKRIVLDDIGEVTISRSRRAKHIRLSIKPFEGIRVAVPYGVSFSEAERIALLHSDWLKKHAEKVERLERETIARLIESGPIDRKAASENLIQRLLRLASLHGFSFKKVSIRNQRSRWGSCSEKNNISLNIHLIRLPSHLIDYTILHELVHTRIKTHGKPFWEELEKFAPDAKKLDKELKKYHLIPSIPAISTNTLE